MFPVVFLPSAGDTAVWFPGVVDAIQLEAVAVVSVADNRADDIQAEIPDSSLPTSTGFRNKDCRRNTPRDPPSSFASRNNPIRNWVRYSASRLSRSPLQTKSPSSLPTFPRCIQALPPALRTQRSGYMPEHTRFADLLVESQLRPGFLSLS
jgi:hypothetical protein